jgi:transposase
LPEVGYWKCQHANAVKRIERLKEELDQSRGQVHALQDKLFGRKSEKSAFGDRSNGFFDPEEATVATKRRGAQPGHTGHGRRDYSHLPVDDGFVALPEESLVCPIRGKLATMMSGTEDSEVFEIDVRAHRRRIRRRRYRVACDCDPTRRTLMAPPLPRLIPKGNYGLSIWVLVLSDKYSVTVHRPGKGRHSERSEESRLNPVPTQDSSLRSE